MARMAVALGLLVAVTYGAADFLGGFASRRAPVTSVVVVSQLVGVPLLAVLALFSGGEPTIENVGLGAAAGVAGGLGLTALYRGLATGRMSVVAPVTAVGAAALPVLWGLGAGERPSPLAAVGVACALFAVVFVSRIPGDEARAAGGLHVLLLAALAGVGFGVVFIVLAETGDNGGIWPLLAARGTSMTMLAAGSLVSGRSLDPGGWPSVRIIAATGVLDMAANALYVYAAQRGLISLVAVLSSLYPAATVVLARVVLHERLGRLQTAGLGLAAGGVMLIAAG